MVLTGGMIAGGMITPSGALPPKPPPNPTDQQLHSARAQQDALSDQVGSLGAQIASAEAQLEQLRGKAELAEQKVALRVSQLRDAEQAAGQAKAKVAAAAQEVSDAHQKFVQYVQATYMYGSPDDTAGTLLTSTDPSSLLDNTTLQQYQSDANLDAIGLYQRATVRKSNAEAAARRAVARSQQAKKAAQQAKQEADDAVASSEQQEAALQASLAASRRELETKQLQLATLTNQRAKYVAYMKEKARLEAIARAKAERERQARLAAARAPAAARARQQNRHSSSGQGSAAATYGPAAPTGGSWSAAKGERAVERAQSTIGTPYAWAGGGSFGPSRGVCDSSNGAPNDCYVTGYDCSGLVMYAWGKGWAHYAATQYNQAGSYHPSAGSLKPGDLIFWSYNGTVSGIHHVAIYKGGGQIIEAPYSGGYVQTSSLYAYGSFFGATRPLT